MSPPQAAPPAGTGARPPHDAGGGIRVSPRLIACAGLSVEDVFRELASSTAGLSVPEAAGRLLREGPNEVAVQRPVGWPMRLFRMVRNPLVLLLTVLAVVALATGDVRAATVISLMIGLGVTLRFVQESRADQAAAALRAMIRVTATVVRDGETLEIPLREVVPGDLVHLTAGDMVPADLRLVAAKDLFVNQATLTGESLAVEKSEEPAREGTAPLEMDALCFLGTNVQSGTGSGIVVTTGADTYFGSMAGTIATAPESTAFDRGIDRFTWLMIRFIAVMVPLVFVINGLTKHDWREAFFFAMAVAVGLTPEMLPMIVSVCLSKGAVAMSRRKVIVKRLDAIQNFGAMDVLCTDKTGTLTMDAVILERHCDVRGEESESVLLAASLVSQFQTGLRSVLDHAILEYLARHPHLSLEGYQKIDEIPFDFSRRLMSVVVQAPDGSHRLLCKGAPEGMFHRCTRVEISGEVLPLDPVHVEAVQREYDALSSEGFRVLAVAYRDFPGPEAHRLYATADEAGLVLSGYVAFLDPPKESTRPALEALRASGVSVKVLTGDNELVTRTICRQVHLATDHVLLGADVERMSDAELAEAASRTTVFARVSPSDKQRIIQALKAKGHVVGFLGDGINDAPALRAADVGVSVDTAVDIAKESADIILLEKSLLVLQEGVLEGRKVFSNVLKYIRMGASSNFGNMFSVLGASAWLPFLPMAPIQVLTNNLLYDFSQVPIPTDNVDAEQITRPRPWDIGELTRFILFIGPLSSIFDYTTYLVMYFVFGATTPAKAALFQTGWFVESLMTQTLIIHVIRTNRIPFIQSLPSRPLMATTAAIMAMGLLLPISPVAPALGFVPLPMLYWPILAATLSCYLVLTQLVKSRLLRRGWI